MMLHGGDVYGAAAKTGIPQEKLKDFSANLSPLGVPEGIFRAINDELVKVVHYPDPMSRRLREAIAASDGVSPEHIICGCGAADIIYRFVYGVQPKRALLLEPTFVEYEEALSVIGAEVEGYPLNRKDFKIREDILEYMTEGLDVVFICTPNNPTGVVTEKNLLLKILEKARLTNTILVLDECFLDFLEDEKRYSLVRELDKYDNLLILKSFTKMFSIPGVRLGYGLCSNKNIMERLYKAGQDWSVSTMAEAAGIAALKEKEYVKKVIQYVNKERKYMESALEQMGISYIHGAANYMLIYKENCPDLYDQLLERGIILRKCSNYRNLTNDYYRIAINRHEDNAALMEALYEICGTYLNRCV